MSAKEVREHMNSLAVADCRRGAGRFLQTTRDGNVSRHVSGHVSLLESKVKQRLVLIFKVPVSLFNEQLFVPSVLNPNKILTDIQHTGFTGFVPVKDDR
jgi:hypothetical protein